MSKSRFHKIWLFLIPVFTGLGGAISRMLGGGLIKLPDLVNEMLYAALFASSFLIIGWAVDGQVFEHWEQTLAVFICTILTGNMGHYDFFYDHDKTRDQTMTPVAMFIYKRMFGVPVDRRDWRYDAIGMALVGIAATLPAGIALMTIGYVWEGVLFGLSGALKAWFLSLIHI